MSRPGKFHADAPPWLPLRFAAGAEGAPLPFTPGVVPALIVVLVLIALLTLPIVIQQRLDSARRDLDELAGPAREGLAQAQLLIARQTAELRAYILTRDPAHLEDYARFARRERELYPRLEDYAGELDPDFLADVVELRTLSEQWHGRLGVEEKLRGAEPDDPLDQLVDDDAPLRMLETASRAELTLEAVTTRTRGELRSVQRIGQLGYYFLLLLGLGGILAVGVMSGRIRGFAAEAAERRADVRRAVEDAERMIAARSDLIRGFTHDVKNPLGAADGYAQLLEGGVRGELTPEQKATVESIRRSIRGAIEIIERLLDLSRLESGGLQIERERVDVDELLRIIVRHHQGAATSAGIDLSVVSRPGDRVAVVYSDPARIKQVLDNLISNALKYTPRPGRVLVGAQIQTTEIPPRPGHWLAIAVSDSGPGIPAEETERIFDEFHRVPGSVGRGHGLGLAISRRVARLLGGEVTVRSALGEGSTFLLWLPVREEEVA